MRQFEPRTVLLRAGFDGARVAEIAQVFHAVFGDHALSPSSPEDDLYVRNLQRLARPAQSSAAQASIDTIGQAEDAVARNPGQFTFAKALNWSAMAAIPASSRGPLLVATVRNEGPFLVEWLAHNRAIGFDDIVLYSHDNSDGSEVLLEALARHKVIRLQMGEAGADINPQVKAYEHALHLDPDSRRHRWWMTLDADEFLIPDERFDYSLARFIATLETAPGAPDCVCFNWVWMGSGGAVARTNRRVTDRFVVGAPTVPFVKSLFRPRSALSLRGVHKPTLVPNSVIVNSALHPIPPDNHDTPFEFAGGRINHYWNKSFEEFLVKQARGRERSVWRRGTELFFDWDIPANLAQDAAVPAALRARVELEHDRLLSIPDISSAHRAAEVRYAELVKTLHPGHLLDEAYSAAKARVRILRSLRKTPMPNLRADAPLALKTALRSRSKERSGRAAID